MKRSPAPAVPARRPAPPPAPVAGSGAAPLEVKDLGRSVWLREGARPGREDRCREEVDCRLWLTQCLSQADRTAP